MARDYAKLFCSVWTDDGEWKERTSDAQRLYMLAYSQPDVSYAGVVPYRPRRWATMSKDSSLTKVRRGLAELEANGYIVIDADTQELLVRSFIRHDDPFKIPNMTRAMVSAYRAILSHHLRDVVLGELARLYRDAMQLPDHDRPRGWDAVILRPRAEGGLLEDLEATLERRDD